MKRYSVLVLVPVILLGGCSSMKKTLGMERSAPDEFAVVERAPLTVPPNFDLVPPQPGATRPQEQTAASAKGLILGSESSAPKASDSSRVESAILNKVGGNANNDTIRQQLSGPDTEAPKETVAQQLGITSSDTAGKALDPATEAQRLKTQNVKTTPTQAPDKNAQ